MGPWDFPFSPDPRERERQERGEKNKRTVQRRTPRRKTDRRRGAASTPSNPSPMPSVTATLTETPAREHVFTRPDGTVLRVPAKYENPRTRAHIDRTLRAYKRPHGDQGPRYEAITTAADEFATLLADLCPESAELTLAIRAVEEARMRANQAIAVNE